MNTINIFTTILFFLMGCVAFVCAFFNSAHIFTAAVCFALSLIGFVDNSNGRSIYEWIKEKLSGDD